MREKDKDNQEDPRRALTNLGLSPKLIENHSKLQQKLAEKLTLHRSNSFDKTSRNLLNRHARLPPIITGSSSSSSLSTTTSKFDVKSAVPLMLRPPELSPSTNSTINPALASITPSTQPDSRSKSISLALTDFNYKRRLALQRWKWAIDCIRKTLELTSVSLSSVLKNSELIYNSVLNQSSKKPNDKLPIVFAPPPIESATMIADKIGFQLSDYQFSQKTNVTMKQITLLLTRPKERFSEQDHRTLLKLVDQLPCFAKYDQGVRRALFEVAHYECYGRHRVIVKQGHQALNYYVLLSGEVEVLKLREDPLSFNGANSNNSNNGMGTYTSVSVLRSGDAFGELALIKNENRSSTIITRCRTELLRIEKDDFLHVLKSATEQDILEKTSLLDAIPLFRTLPNRIRKLLGSMGQVKEFSKDEVVFKEGDGFDFVYVIKSGKARIMKQVPFIKVPQSSSPQQQQSSQQQQQQQQTTNYKLIKYSKDTKIPSNGQLVTVWMNVAEVTAEDHFGESVILSTLDKVGDEAGNGSNSSSNGQNNVTNNNISNANANNTKHQKQYNTDITKAPYSLVADSRLSVLIISRVDFTRCATASTTQHIHHMLKERQMLWNLDCLQDLYIEKMNWEKHKQSQIMDVMERIADSK